MKKHTRGFTLIELMVVISIIGVLSSVVIASLSVARDKGRVASGLKFATYTYHAFGADAVGQWNFDETPSNAIAKDLSGNNRNLSASTGNLSRNYVNTPTRTGGSLVVTAGGGHATSPVSGVQNTLGNFTAAAWIYPTSPLTGSGAILAANNNAGLDVPFVMYINNTLAPGYAVVVCASTIFGGTLASNNLAYILKLDKWNHVACSLNTKQNPAVFTMYVDGQSASMPRNTLAGMWPARTIDTVSVGGASQGFTPQYGGLIDDAAIYTQTLTASEIQHIYAQGAAAHGLAVEE